MKEVEFYADRLAYRLERNVRRTILVFAIINFLAVAVYWLGKIFGTGPMGDFYKRIQTFAETNLSPVEQIVFYSSPVWILVMIGFLPAIVKYIRKSFLYPSKSMTAKGISMIRDRISRTWGGTERLHYVIIEHPHDRRPVPVQVDKLHFFQFRKGDRVVVRYRPGAASVLCMSAYSVARKRPTYY